MEYFLTSANSGENVNEVECYLIKFDSCLIHYLKEWLKQMNRFINHLLD